MGSDVMSGRVRWSLQARQLPVVLAGGYAWLVSVFPVADQAGLSSQSGLLAGAALAALLLSLLAPSRFWALLLSLHGFILGCLLCWGSALGAEAAPNAPYYGALGWLAYTIALGSLSSPATASERARLPAGDLRPRVAPSVLAALCIVVGTAAGLFLFGLALQVHRPELSILAQISALAVVLLVLRNSSHLAHYYQRRSAQAVFAPKLGATLWLLFALVGVLAAGLVTGWAAG